MKKFTLIKCTLLVALLLCAQWSWATVSKRSANGELFKTFIYGTTNSDNLIAGGSISFSSVSVTDNLWDLSSGGTITLSLDNALAAGDVISVELAYSSRGTSNGLRLRVGDTEGQALTPGSDYTVPTGEAKHGEIVTRTYTIPKNDTYYVGNKSLKLLRSTSSGCLPYVRSIIIKRSGSDCNMPGTLSGEKTWNFSSIGTSDDKIDRNIVSDELYYGCTGSEGKQMNFTTKTTDKVVVLNLGSTGSQFKSLPPSKNGNSLMFIVPAGSGTVSIEHIAQSSSKFPNLLYYIGTTSGILTSSNNNASSWTTYYINYSVDVPTPVWIYSTSNSGNSDIKSISVKPGYQSATIGTTGYATFSSTSALDFSSVTDLTAYIATGVSDSKVTLAQVSKVPANTGLVLKANSTLSAATTYSIPVTSETTDNETNNLLQAVSTETTVSAGESGTANYVLAASDGEAGFYTINATSATVPAGHAYLQVSASNGAKKLSFDFGETTGIENIKATGNNAQASSINANAVYNLAGQKVGKDYKGIVIINGKKYIRK